MTAFLYQDQTTYSNVTFGIFGSSFFSGKRNLRDLSGHTVIILADEIIDDNLSRAVADRILENGCKNIVLYGGYSEELQDIFDREDREINGFNDITGYEDFAVIRRFEDLDELPDEIEMCGNEVIVLCSDMSLLRESRRLLG